MEISEYVTGMIEETLRYARSSERARAVMLSLEPPLKGLRDLIDLDPDLRPEIVATVQGIEDALGAIDRLGDFLGARHDAAVARLSEGLSDA